MNVESLLMQQEVCRRNRKDPQDFCTRPCRRCKRCQQWRKGKESPDGQ